MALTKASSLLPWAAATASLLVMALLVLVPCAVLVCVLGPGPQHLWLLELPLACWAVWSLVSLWAALDSSKLWRMLGRPVDPLGSYGFWGMFLGMVNVGTSLLVVVLRTSR
jgi:hypothetical protein